MDADSAVIVRTPDEYVARGLHGAVILKDGVVRAVVVRGDNSRRAHENRFHEMLHALEVNGGIRLDHDLIRRLAKIYSEQPVFYGGILDFRSQ